MDNIVYSKEELRNIAGGVRVCINKMLEGKTPYSFFLDSKNYWEYVSKYKCDIINFLPVNYLGFKHKHRDTYFHYASKEKLNNILADGYLRMDMSHEECSVGKAVYTYPVKSGMYFLGKQEDSGILMFEAEEEHCHITQTDDTPYCIGEADFFCDVKILNPKILTPEEANKISEESFNWETAQKEYYGIDVVESANHSNYLDILEHYNYDYKPMQQN